jgi:hypothetical protein
MKMPWTRRADAERDARLKAEARANATTSDWMIVKPLAAAIEYEDRLNNWTRHAKALFSGRAS